MGLDRWSPYLAAGLSVFVVGMLVWVVAGGAPAAGVGDPIPDVVATDLEGNRVSPGDLSGRVFLLNIWATWCAPCREEMPSMQALRDHFDGEPFEVVAISIDGGWDHERIRDRIDAFVQGVGLSFVVWHDPSANTRRRLGTAGVPETFLVGADGVIRERVIGVEEWDHPRWIDAIERLIQEVREGAT